MPSFTLIETILYIGILSLIFTGSISSAIALHDASQREQGEAARFEQTLIERDRADLGTHSIP